MNTYQMPPTSLPLDDSWDVIVAGGGPAGCTAAAAAAREGARTLLLEQSQQLGGSGTSALVPAWCPFSDKEKIIYRGLAETVLTRAKDGITHVAPEALDWVPIDPERLKRVYDDLVTSAGATVRFGSFLASVDAAEVAGEEGRAVRAVIVASKGGLRAYRAKVFVDCTGDADLSAWAGAETHKGDAQGKMQPTTHCFVLANVNEAEYTRQGLTHKLHPHNPESVIFRIQASGRYPLIPDFHICSNVVGPGTVGFNAGHVWNVDNTDPASVSRGVMQGRKIAEAYRAALAEFLPEVFGQAFLVATGSQLGIRETRRVVGDYVLTLDDYLARRTFTDEICRNSYFIDIHLAEDAERDGQKGMMAWEKTTIRYEKGESHGIPYRCLTPRGLRNVLVAGRTISCERVVQGSVRVMPVCLAMGEAAGMAAAHAARGHSGDVHAVDVARLHERLREEGGYLPEVEEALMAASA